jgi:hypothetical protein
MAKEHRQLDFRIKLDFYPLIHSFFRKNDQ